MTGLELSTYAMIAAGAAVASTAVSAVGAIQQGKAAQASAKFNADMMSRNAQIARQQAAAEEEKHRRLTYMRQGAARAAYGASGVSIEGSPLDILEQSAAQEELDALNIRYRGEIGAQSAEGQADLSLMRGESAMSAGYMGAGSSILLGAARAGSIYAPSPSAAPSQKLEQFKHTSAGGPWM
jgi:hypothetical protein